MRRPNAEYAARHIHSRGARRLDLFQDDEDREVFLGLLTLAAAAAGVFVRAYCLMDNHYHMVVEAGKAAITKLMHSLNLRYSIYYNRKYGESGHSFDREYSMWDLLTLGAIMNAIAYVFLNPVVDGKAPSAGAYRWSSYGDYVGGPRSPFHPHALQVLALLHPNPAEARAEFLTVMNRVASRPRRPKSECPAIEIQSELFEGMLEKARTSRPPGLRSTVVALAWGKSVGIPPRAMARVLGEDKLPWVYKQLKKWRELLAQYPLS